MNRMEVLLVDGVHHDDVGVTPFFKSIAKCGVFLVVF